MLFRSQEVRALAQRSANASKDIKALIAESNQQVKTGASLVNQAGESLTGIVSAVKKVTDIVAEIAAASREQATGLEQINTAVASMDEMTQRNGALVEETSAAAQALATQAGELAELVGFFKLDTQLAPAAQRVQPAAVTAQPRPQPSAPPKPAPAPVKNIAKPASNPAPQPAQKPAPAMAVVTAGDDDDWQEF
nr:methyl-accepting chemotaxis protein [uncultured Ferrovibrio sp.]